jgi:hypothetical protein
MACTQRTGIVYPSIIFRKSLFYNEKVDLIRPHLAPNKKGPIKDGPFWGSEPRLSRGAICRSSAP